MAMYVYVDLIITWVLFLALFPVTFVWYRQAWRIAVKRDFSSVALKEGEAPPNPAKFAPFTLASNLIAATVTLSVILGVVSATLPKDEWTAIAGVTIWCKLIFNFALSRHAHLGVKSARKLEKERVADEKRAQELEEKAAKSKVVPLEREDKAFKMGVIYLPDFYADFSGGKEGTSSQATVC